MKRAVVLSGGGSRGGYEVGVWRALRELGLDFQIVTGTSVGSLNGLMMVQGDYEKAVEMWKALTPEQVMNLTLPETARKAEGLFEFLRQSVFRGGADVSPLANTLERVIDYDRFYASPVDFGLVTVAYPSFRPLVLKKEEIPREKLKDYLMASAACFPAFQPHVIDEKQYVDGGFFDNVPINLAIEMGAEEIIAVELQDINLVRPVRNKGIKIIRIGRKKRSTLGPLLVFNPSQTMKNMNWGYQDCMKAFGRLEGDIYSFSKGFLKGECKRLKREYARLFHSCVKSYSYSFDHVAAMAHLKRALGGYLSREGVPSLERALLRSAECAAGILGLDDTAVYTSCRFHSAIREKLKTADSLPPGVREVILDGGLSPKEKLDRLGRLSGPDLLHFACQRLRQLDEGTFSARKMNRISAVFPQFVLGAVYCEALRRTSKKMDG